MLFIGCSNLTEEITEKYENGAVKTVKYFSSNNSTRYLIKELQYYPDGTMAYKKQFKNDMPSGEWQFWHSNGNVWSVGLYKKGQRVGESKVYHENGQLFFRGEYVDGQKNGEWIFYNNEGVIETKTTFDKGTVIENWNAETKNKN